MARVTHDSLVFPEPYIRTFGLLDDFKLVRHDVELEAGLAACITREVVLKITRPHVMIINPFHTESYYLESRMKY